MPGEFFLFVTWFDEHATARLHVGRSNASDPLGPYLDRDGRRLDATTPQLVAPSRWQWERGFAAFAAFVEREGHADVPSSHVEGEDFKLGRWLRTQRKRYQALYLALCTHNRQHMHLRINRLKRPVCYEQKIALPACDILVIECRCLSLPSLKCFVLPL